MTVNQAFRYELDPSVRQQKLLAKAAGTARYAFNWGLNLCKRLVNAGKPVPHAAELHRRWNAEKPQRSWVYGVSKCCGQEALRDLDRAFANFWSGRKKGRRVGFPRFRRKHGRRDAFRLTGSIKVHPRSVTLPRLGCVRTKETTEKFRGRILSATVSREADRWYVSLAVEVERDDPQPVEGPVVGIDLAASPENVGQMTAGAVTAQMDPPSGVPQLVGDPPLFGVMPRRSRRGQRCSGRGPR